MSYTIDTAWLERGEGRIAREEVLEMEGRTGVDGVAEG
jgi:hypothetical protein